VSFWQKSDLIPFLVNIDWEIGSIGADILFPPAAEGDFFPRIDLSFAIQRRIPQQRGGDEVMVQMLK